LDYDEQDPKGSEGQKSDPRRPQPQPPMNRMNRSMFGWVILVGLAVALFVFLSKTQFESTPKTPGELLTYAKSGQLEKVIVRHDRIEASLKKDAPNPPPGRRIVVVVSAPGKEYLYKELMTINPLLIEEEKEDVLFPLIINMLPWFLLFGMIYFFLFRGLRSAGGGGGMLGNFGRSRHKLISKEMTNVTLNDVAGITEAKDEVGEIIEFLRNPKKFQRLGGRIPRGVLLIGEPGCGKTLLAKAVAGEAEVPFFSISGSDFVEMFVGVGASRVRDLFKQAKDSSPCIIFLDEIDAVGRRRGSGFTTGGHDEREQTLNAILVEMDGFESSDQVIVVAATNRADVLDPALTRPGRFDRQIHVPLPDVQGRLEILSVHAKKVKLSPAADMTRLARSTPMFSGAQLAAIINEAAIIATLANKDFVEQADLEEARDKVRFGRAFKSRKTDEDERIGTAYHEAGHALVQKLLPHADPLHKVTIIPRGQSLGSTMSLPEKDRYGYGFNYLRDTMRVLCGGRIAEQKKTGDVTSGAAMDIRMGTRMARHMILEWGMSPKLGFVDYATPEQREGWVPDKTYSEQTARIVDEEVKKYVDEAYAEAQSIIDANWDKIVLIAEALLKYETLSADDVDKLMKGQMLDKPTVGDLIDAEAAKKPRRPPTRPLNPGHDVGPDTGPMPSPA
jgi:cell division protease FtsH